MKKGLVIGIVALVVVLAAAAVGYIVITGRLNKPEEAEETSAEASPSDVGPSYTFDTFIVNVAETQARRYLKCTLTMELSSPKGIEEASAKVPLLRDAVIDVLSAKTLDQLEPGDTRDQIREELAATLKQLISKAVVTRVFFNEFVVQ